MSETVIRVENLSKKYIIGHERERYTALRDVIANGIKSIGKRFSKQEYIDPNIEEFWALKDISFEIKQGDRVGIIGRNGAGKSTLLKILSRITEPTTGKISIKGRVASLLEVGTGFHPELTGRENIYLNGAILGMDRTEIKRKFDEIVTFAEIEKFLDTPVKRYSSGMYVRLAFAVAAHLEPEILIVDEVLAVGDAQFQKKCLGKMEDVGKEGRTVLFVSHNMTAIRTLCSTAMLLKTGKLVSIGSSLSCLKIHEAENIKNQGSVWKRSEKYQNGSLVITQITIDLIGKQPNLELEIELHLKSLDSHKPAFLAIDILDSTGAAIMQAIPCYDDLIYYKRTLHLLRINIHLPPLIPGKYLVSAWVGSHNDETIDWIKEAVLFEINESPILNRSYPYSIDHGYIIPISSCIKLKY
ncbi:ABC transporter ATP-binding protein [Pseudanabaena mucicola]|uniref:ABC transporter ATP-binding protein n=1 Tax=Pseudanabaena mucicola TaxID=71190 RepID=UPI00257751B8|nr:polysaccharide ABC transporter ATP-binding protein [Pseudanabaena mucicola]